MAKCDECRSPDTLALAGDNVCCLNCAHTGPAAVSPTPVKTKKAKQMPYGEGGRFVPGFSARALSGAATTQSPQIDPGMVAQNVAVAVNVTATGGTTPNLTLSVQWSNDGAAWYTADPADSFTAITAVGKAVKTFASKGRYLRLNEVFTGTSPTATYSADVWTLQAMATFTPPTSGKYTPSVTPLTPVWQQSPAKFFSLTNIPKPPNIFKLLDGTYTDKQPASQDSIDITYLGGHTYTVTAAEAIALTAAGYGSSLT